MPSETFRVDDHNINIPVNDIGHGFPISASACTPLVKGQNSLDVLEDA